MKRGIIVVVLLLIIVFNLFWISTYNRPDESVTGAFIGIKNFVLKATTSVGNIFITFNFEIYIVAPENITYNFDKDAAFELNLTVWSNRDNLVDTYWYTLLDLTNDVTYNDSVIFTPNITILTLGGPNRLTVFANDTIGNTANSSIEFNINVSNTAPVINITDSEIYVCEGDSLSYAFNVTDDDADNLTSDISPKNPFYSFPVSWTANGETSTLFYIVSGVLDKDDVGGLNQSSKLYEETVSITDGNYAATADVNITVIEINNAPVIETIGVQTVWTQGENSTFENQVSVTDTEYDAGHGELTYNISFSNNENLFGINGSGFMNYTPSANDTGVYNITICINDTGLDNPFAGISGNCSQDGGSQSTCTNFSLTVTDENRAPTITDYYPANLTLNGSGSYSFYFNITEYDPDGTLPDAYWYADGVGQEYDTGSLIDEFSYSFGCGVSGAHTIKAEITDGVANDSVTWAVSVTEVVCPVSPPGGGGGGGAIGGCIERWVCDNWKFCQNAKKSLEIGVLSGEDYRIIKDACINNGLDDKSCGFQIRTCFDLGNCSTSYREPLGVQYCHYTESPTCFDGIKNCHDGECEFLVDCGGPCSPCATCSDNIQNQGEHDVDCGGPCPACPVEVPMKKVWVYYFWIFLLLILILIIILIIILIRIILFKRKIKDKKKNRK